MIMVDLLWIVREKCQKSMEGDLWTVRGNQGIMHPRVHLKATQTNVEDHQDRIRVMDHLDKMDMGQNLDSMTEEDIGDQPRPFEIILVLLVEA